jgi:dUTP pyrophosphatase
MIQFKLLHNYATTPTRGTDGSAGFDLYATDNHLIHPGARVKIPTGVSVAMPEGYAGFMWPRSGFAVKHGFDLLAGLIDADFRGELQIAGINHGDKAIEIRRGDRVAQLVVSPVMTLMEVVGSLDETGRGNGAFGSTGV